MIVLLNFNTTGMVRDFNLQALLKLISHSKLLSLLFKFKLLTMIPILGALQLNQPISFGKLLKSISLLTINKVKRVQSSSYSDGLMMM